MAYQPADDRWADEVIRQIDVLATFVASLSLRYTDETSPEWRALKQFEAVAHALLDARMRSDRDDGQVLLTEASVLVSQFLYMTMF